MSEQVQLKPSGAPRVSVCRLSEIRMDDALDRVTFIDFQSVYRHLHANEAAMIAGVQPAEVQLALNAFDAFLGKRNHHVAYCHTYSRVRETLYLWPEHLSEKVNPTKSAPVDVAAIPAGNANGADAGPFQRANRDIAAGSTIASNSSAVAGPVGLKACGVPTVEVCKQSEIFIDSARERLRFVDYEDIFRLLCRKRCAVKVQDVLPGEDQIILQMLNGYQWESKEDGYSEFGHAYSREKLTLYIWPPSWSFPVGDAPCEDEVDDVDTADDAPEEAAAADDPCEGMSDDDVLAECIACLRDSGPFHLRQYLPVLQRFTRSAQAEVGDAANGGGGPADAIDAGDLCVDAVYRHVGGDDVDTPADQDAEPAEACCTQ